MKKQYSISFFAVSIMCVLLLSFAYRMDYENMKLEAKDKVTKEEHSLETEGNASKAEVYYLKELNGFVAVYLNDKKTVYEYTTIPLENLPQEVAKEIEKGMPIASEESLYSFLEGYSS